MNIGKKPVVVGRGDHADLIIDDPSVSSTHAELVRRGGVIQVKDLGSTNGTFVNSSRISVETELHDGDLVNFGEAAFELIDGTLTEPEPEIERTQIISPSTLAPSSESDSPSSESDSPSSESDSPSSESDSPSSESEVSSRQRNPAMAGALAALVVAGIVLATVLTSGSSDADLTSAESAYIDARVEEIRTGNFDSSGSINFASSKGMTSSEVRCVLEGLLDEHELGEVRDQFGLEVPDAAFAKAAVEGVSGCADLRRIIVADVAGEKGLPDEIVGCTLAEISDQDVINLVVTGILEGDQESAAVIEATKPLVGPLFACAGDLLSVEEFFDLMG
jgi:pSer/pThr/pTyr-binding forkhead associated (FHA) protein